jgi:hypothetical protein
MPMSGSPNMHEMCWKVQEALSRRCIQQGEALQCAEKRATDAVAQSQQLQEQLQAASRNVGQLVCRLPALCQPH